MTRLAVVLAALLVAAPAMAQDESLRPLPDTVRVRFPHGASEVVVRGYATDCVSRDYVLLASAGQTLSLRFTDPRHGAAVWVIAPRAADTAGPWVMPPDAPRPDGTWSAVLPEDGDYRVRLTGLSPRATSFRLRLAVHGAPRTPAQVATDARPAGHYVSRSGGTLDVRAERDGRLRFELALRRGAHRGSAEGTMSQLGTMATYERNADCRMQFFFMGERVEVVQVGNNHDCGLPPSVVSAGDSYRRQDAGDWSSARRARSRGALGP